MIKKNILIIGLGSIGERYVRNLLKIGSFNIFVLRRKKSINSKPRTFNINKIKQIDSINKNNYQNFKYVIIANPTSMHKKYIEKFALNKKILCEIPILKDLNINKKIKNYLLNNNENFMAGFNFRFHPQLLLIKNMIDKKKFGKVLYSRLIFGEQISSIHEWDNYKNRYEVNKKLGGGVLRTSCHEIDIAFFLFGKIKSCTGVKKNLLYNIDCEDFTNIILEHQNNVISNITLDFVSNQYTRNLHIAFENAILLWDFKKNLINIKTNKTNKTIFMKKDFNETYIDQTKVFLNLSNKNKKNISNFKDSYYVQKIIDAVDKSALNLKKVSLKN